MANDSVQTVRLDAPIRLVESLVSNPEIRVRWARDDSPVSFDHDDTGVRLSVHSTEDWSEAFRKLRDLVAALKGDDREISITRLIMHPVERVFAAFSNPAGMAQWWGPNGFTTTTKTQQFRVGGAWDYVMHGPGGTDYPNYVSYTAIEKNQRIAYDHGTGAEHPALFKAEILFAPEDKATRVTLKLTLANATERPGYVAFGAVEGGYQNLARLEKWLDREISSFSTAIRQRSNREETMSDTGSTSFVLSRDLNAPRELVFTCFSDPQHLQRWWGPKGVEIVNGQMDFRPGGIYHYGMKWPTGAIMWGLFKFRAITPPTRIEFLNCFSNEKAEVTRAPFFDGKWPLEMLSVFAFEEIDAKRTRFTLTWQPHNATPEEMAVFAANHASAAEGWAGTMEKLKSYLATLKQA